MFIARGHWEDCPVVGVLTVVSGASFSDVGVLGVQCARGHARVRLDVSSAEEEYAERACEVTVDAEQAVVVIAAAVRGGVVAVAVRGVVVTVGTVTVENVIIDIVAVDDVTVNIVTVDTVTVGTVTVETVIAGIVTVGSVTVVVIVTGMVT